MRVEQNNFRDMFSVYLSVTAQAQHVFCVSPAARVAHTGLAGEEWLKAFPLQTFQHGDGGECTHTVYCGKYAGLHRKYWEHSASVLRVSADGHGVSGLQHNQNDWLVA